MPSAFEIKGNLQCIDEWRISFVSTMEAVDAHDYINSEFDPTLRPQKDVLIEKYKSSVSDRFSELKKKTKELYEFLDDEKVLEFLAEYRGLENIILFSFPDQKCLVLTKETALKDRQLNDYIKMLAQYSNHYNYILESDEIKRIDTRYIHSDRENRNCMLIPLSILPDRIINECPENIKRLRRQVEQFKKQADEIARNLHSKLSTQSTEPLQSGLPSVSRYREAAPDLAVYVLSKAELWKSSAKQYALLEMAKCDALVTAAVDNSIGPFESCDQLKSFFVARDLFNYELVQKFVETKLSRYEALPGLTIENLIISCFPELDGNPGIALFLIIHCGTDIPWLQSLWEQYAGIERASKEAESYINRKTESYPMVQPGFGI